MGDSVVERLSQVFDGVPEDHPHPGFIPRIGRIQPAQEKKVVDGSTPDGTGQLLVLYLDHSKLTLRAIDRVDISPDSVSVTRETVRSAG